MKVFQHPVNWGGVIAAVIGGFLGVLLTTCERGPELAAAGECPGFVLSSGHIEAHLSDPAAFTVGEVVKAKPDEPITVLLLNPNNPSIYHARRLANDGRTVVLCLVPLERRDLQRITR